MSETKSIESETPAAVAGAAPCSAAAMRAAERILQGVDVGAIRYHGPRADGQWCWQYRSPSQIAAIIEEEMTQQPNAEVRQAGPDDSK